MVTVRMVEPSGRVFRVDRRRGPVWYAKYRLPDGRQVQKKLGPAWTQRGRPAAGFHTKRTAEAWLRDVLDQARRGVLPGMTQTGVTFAVAVEEYLRWLEVDRERKPSTLRDYRSIIRTHLLPAFGEQLVEDITYDDVERWRLALPAITNRTKVKIITVLYGIMERARRTHRLPFNPVRDIEKPIARVRVELDDFSPEDVWALVRAAESEQDAAIFLTAAFTGLRRGELVALRWRDVDFAGSHLRVARSYTEGHLTTPKSGRIRSVPMAPDVATVLARLGQRDHAVGLDDLVFPGPFAEFLDASALYRRYKAALARGPATAALPRPSTHVRHDCDPQGVNPAGQGVDGPRGRRDHDALPALRAAFRRRAAHRRSVCVARDPSRRRLTRSRRRHDSRPTGRASSGFRHPSCASQTRAGKQRRLPARGS